MECSVVIAESESDEHDEMANATTSNDSTHCRICGGDNAAIHYGAISCVGCKGFFRRALLKADQLECVTGDGDCPVNRSQKIQCRSCRFNKCLREGMKPAFVRPNRDVPPKPRKPPQIVRCEMSSSGRTTKTRDEWMKKLTVDMRTMMMTLLNIESKIMKGDTNIHASKIYPLKDVDKLRDIVTNPLLLKGKRTQMRYEPYRMAANDELCAIAYRRLIAAVDWVDNLSPLLGHISVDDKIALIKQCYIPLMVFNCCARTAEVTNDRDVLCLCNFAYVPRNISKMYSETYHLGNGLVERALEELVAVYREYGIAQEEIVCINALLVLNPLAKDVSDVLFDKIIELRNRITDCLYSIVKEVRLSATPNVCFGHILMSLSTVAELASSMSENIVFAQTFSIQGEIPLLTDLFGCFTVEPFFKEYDESNRMANLSLNKQNQSKDAEVQTDRIPPPRMQLKRNLTSDELDDAPPTSSFRLLQPPNKFFLTEIFDDLRNNPEERMLETLSYEASTIQPSIHNQPQSYYQQPLPVNNYRMSSEWPQYPIIPQNYQPQHQQQQQTCYNYNSSDFNQYAP